MKLILLELNEVNFTSLEKYIELGELKNFKTLFEKYSYTKTVAEKAYPNLEPWIQWVTVHTGKSYAEHDVFRLGDAVQKDLPQIWDVLEAQFGINVAAISPMNAGAKAKNPKFFIPDPWSSNVVKGSWDLKLLFSAVKQIVNDNAKNKIELGSYLKLGIGFLFNLRIKNLPKYFQLLHKSFKQRWFKALLLDRVLMDTFISQWKKHQPDFSSIFLNAGAHIQHHYMYNSAVYTGSNENPDWYVDTNADPVLDLYREYDSLLGSINELENVRMMVCTGLSQLPNPIMTYQYRLNEHGRFLKALNINYQSVTPLMSRDFSIQFVNTEAAFEAQNNLEKVHCVNGIKIFYVDNRGDNLFCKIDYYGPLTDIQDVMYGEQTITDFSTMISLASIENGIHSTIGYFVDTGTEANLAKDKIKLTEVYTQIIDFFRETHKAS